MEIRLECPNCRSTLTIGEWNESVRESVSLGICDELIPEGLKEEDWADYRREHGGRCDCPECGEVALFDDMTAY
jgi:hypothetical protein